MANDWKVYDEIMFLYKKGSSPGEIARKVGWSEKEVRDFLNDEFEESIFEKDSKEVDNMDEEKKETSEPVKETKTEVQEDTKEVGKSTEPNTPPEKKEEAKQEETPKEEVETPEFDAKIEIENLKKGILELSEQVSMIRDILDTLAEEEEAEQPVTTPTVSPIETKPEVQLAKEPPKPEEKKEEAKMQKDKFEELDERFKKLEAEFAKMGVRKTIQSSTIVNADPMAEVAERELKRRGL